MHPVFLEALSQCLHTERRETHDGAIRMKSCCATKIKEQDMGEVLGFD